MGKTIKISKDIHDALVFTKGQNFKKSMTKSIENLLDTHVIYNCTLEQEKDNFYFVIEGRRRLIPKFSSETKIIRVSDNVYETLSFWKQHPDESFNILLFRLICYYYKNKPVYRVFTGHGCGNCKDLIERASKVPEIFLEVLNSEDYLDLMREREVTMLPLSILYDTNGKEVYSAKGWHDFGRVQEEFTKVNMKRY